MLVNGRYLQTETVKNPYVDAMSVRLSSSLSFKTLIRFFFIYIADFTKLFRTVSIFCLSDP